MEHRRGRIWEDSLEVVEGHQEVKGGSEDSVPSEQLGEQGLEEPLQHAKEVEWNKHGS